MLFIIPFRIPVLWIRGVDKLQLEALETNRERNPTALEAGVDGLDPAVPQDDQEQDGTLGGPAQHGGMGRACCSSNWA